MVAGWFPQPTVEPGRAIRGRRHLRADARQIGPMGVDGLRKIRVLVTRKAASDLNHFLASLNIRSRRDSVSQLVVGLHVLEWLTGPQQVMNHGTDFNRFVPLGFLQALAGEVIPETKKSWHLRGWSEVLGISQPRIEPVEPNLAGHVPQTGAHLRQCAGSFGLLQ